MTSAPRIPAAPGDPDRREPLPDALDEVGDLPALTVISEAAMLLMSAAASKLGLADDPETAERRRDLDEARRLITALAGLVTASAQYLGPHAAQIRDALRELQLAFRAASDPEDPPGQGPGESLTGAR